MAPRKCLVADCTARATLFSPRDSEQKVSWQRQIKYTGGINSKSNFRVCEVHFLRLNDLNRKLGVIEKDRVRKNMVHKAKYM